MEMAERYPTDFNGIIAGTPEIIAGPLNAELQTWNYRVNTDAAGNAILTSDKLPALHAAVIAACAGDDGTADGNITDPRNCHFDPASIECPAGTDTTSCLTPVQVAVARDIYQGPVDPAGRHLYPGGLTYGSELSWAGFVIPITPADGGPVSSQAALVYVGLSLPYLRFQYRRPGELGPDPGQWSFDDRSLRSLFGTVDYYDTLAGRMGGLSATERFAREFLPRYNGSGNIDDAASFHPVVSPDARDYSPWIGNDLFYQPIGRDPEARRARS
jgi:hypothetical protein